jgi:LEA14-like dessication related protein
MARRLVVLVALLAFGALACFGCSTPEAPKLTPEKGRITSVTATGMSLEVSLDAYNPNSFALSARSMKGKVILDGKHHIGDVVAPTAIKLPAKKHTKMTVPLSLQYKDISALITLAASRRDVPYRVEGTVELGGDKLNVDAPFAIEGVVTHAELVKATVSSLPNLNIPGLPGAK